MNLLLLIAVAPVIVILVMVYRQDKIEHEPIGLLLKLLLGGALTVISAYILETIGEYLLYMLGLTPETNVHIYNLLMTFIVVAGSEEAGKYFVLKKITWNNPEFDYRFDAIVYAVCASMGFAVVENIMYVFSNGFETGIMRAVLSIPGHAFFAIFMGYYYGEAKLAEGHGKHSLSETYIVKAYWVAVLIHGFYDFCLFEGTTLTMGAFFVFMVIMYINAFKRVRRSSREDIAVEEQPQSFENTF